MLSLDDSHLQPNSDLAQLADHGTDDLGAIFDEIYFVLCNFRSVT